MLLSEQRTLPQGSSLLFSDLTPGKENTEQWAVPACWVGALEGLKELQTNQVHLMIKADLASLFTGRTMEESY